MNGEEGKALCILTTPSPDSSKDLYEKKRKPKLKLKHEDEHWKWRVRIAEQIAAAIDPERFGVFAIYLFGSTNNGTAGPRSDIDLLVHFDGTSHQHKELNIWLEGWDRCLVEILHQHTGNKLDGLLDVHFITHSDIKNKTSWANRINAISDTARPLLLMDKNAG
jgi:predicted nucleotidyltransferase